MGGKTFYDIHCHAFNLSHQDFVSFVQRINMSTLQGLLAVTAIPGVSAIFNLALSSVLEKKMNTLTNLLSVLQRQMGDYFRLMESDLTRHGLLTNGQITLGDLQYDSVVLTPLMMDFGAKVRESATKIYYKDDDHKPIAEQVIDLFNGIRDYLEGEGTHSFEIYPFLGLNTQNYEMEKRRGKETLLPELLGKYFGGFGSEAPGQRRERLREQMGQFHGDLELLGNYAFSGIKVYPPLGFDPWPSEPGELEKVRFLYDYCLEKRIPITAHCSDGGFQVDPKAQSLASPEKWRAALESEGGRYRELRLNLAHFGKQSKWFSGSKWRDLIVRLVKDHPNVYTDISYLGVEEDYYDSLRDLLEENPGIANKVMFGTDFMINLLGIESYYGYMDNFNKTDCLTPRHKDLLCSVNPERFLFA